MKDKTDCFFIGFIVGALVSALAIAITLAVIAEKGITDEATPAGEWGTESFYIEMNVSAYDAGACCCAPFDDGLTASGVPAVGLICAAPPEYPFGTKFTVNGIVYVCEDRGEAIVGNKLDILMESHEKALKWGRRTLMVKIERDGK